MDHQETSEACSPFGVGFISLFCESMQSASEPKQTLEPKPNTAEESQQNFGQISTDKITVAAVATLDTTWVAEAPVLASAPIRSRFPIRLVHRPLSYREKKWLEANGGGEKWGKMSWEKCAEQFERKFRRCHRRALENMWKELQRSHPHFTIEQREWIEGNGGGIEMTWKECAREFRKKFQRNIHQKMLKRKWFEWREECGSYACSVFEGLISE